MTGWGGGQVSVKKELGKPRHSLLPTSATSCSQPYHGCYSATELHTCPQAERKEFPTLPNPFLFLHFFPIPAITEPLRRLSHSKIGTSGSASLGAPAFVSLCTSQVWLVQRCDKPGWREGVSEREEDIFGQTVDGQWGC